MPASSALIVAPCTGAMDPTALIIGCQSACATFALVTVVAGGTIAAPDLMSFMICIALMPPMSRNIPTSARITLKTAPRDDFRRWPWGGVSGAELGVLRESRFVCMIKEQLPELAHYF